MIAQRIKISLLVPFFTYFGLVNPFSQPTALQHFRGHRQRADSLKHDFSVFRKLLIENHPSLYRYREPARLNYLFDSCYSVLNSESTDLDLLRSVRFVMSAVQDGHLYSGPSPLVRKQLEEKSRFFPLRMHFINDSAYVMAQNLVDIPVGARILSVDNQPISAIQTRLFQFIGSDGAIQTKKRIMLNNTFYFYYWLAYGEKPAFDVQYMTADGSLKAKHLPAALKKDIPEIKSSWQKAPLGLSFQGNVALLSISTFDSTEILGHGQDFRQFLKQSFRKINAKKSADLIIDLRGNGGGRDLYGSLLYAYLASKPFRYYARLSAITNKLPYEQFARHLSSFNGLSRSMLQRDDSRGFVFNERSHPNLSLRSPHPKAYRGRVRLTGKLSRPRRSFAQLSTVTTVENLSVKKRAELIKVILPVRCWNPRYLLPNYSYRFPWCAIKWP
jgi:hypothetical protein